MRIVCILLFGLLTQLTPFRVATGAETARVSTQGFKSFPTLPLAFSPTGEFGGVFVGEFDRRTLGGQLLYVRRICLTMGYSPTPTFSIWGEGGLASLQLFIGERQPRGAYGPAFGLGWIWAQPELKWRDITPFISGRATYFQSKLMDDVQGSSRRSRFEWIEGTGLIGLSKPLGVGSLRPSVVFAAFALRYLTQKEFRTLRTPTNYQSIPIDPYKSGIRPGALIGWQRQFKYRITARVCAELYPEGGRLTLAIGQWGAP